MQIPLDRDSQASNTVQDVVESYDWIILSTPVRDRTSGLHHEHCAGVKMRGLWDLPRVETWVEARDMKMTRVVAVSIWDSIWIQGSWSWLACWIEHWILKKLVRKNT